jgi:hypothetical protein
MLLEMLCVRVFCSTKCEAGPRFVTRRTKGVGSAASEREWTELSSRLNLAARERQRRDLSISSIDTAVIFKSFESPSKNAEQLMLRPSDTGRYASPVPLICCSNLQDSFVETLHIVSEYQHSLGID